MSKRPGAKRPSKFLPSTPSADRADKLLQHAQRLHLAREWDAALETYERALKLAPLNPVLQLAHLGCLVERGPHTPELLAKLERYLAENPAEGHAWSYLGDMHRRARRWPEAERCYRRALAYPGSPIAWLSLLAKCVAAQGRPREMVALLGDAARLKPSNKLEQWNRALSRLCLGRWEEGLADYAEREAAGMMGSAARVSEAPLWQGQPLDAGMTLILVQEQGLGDSIMAARYFPAAALTVGLGRTVALVPPPLMRLYELSRLGVEVENTLHDTPIEHDLRAYPLTLPHTLGLGPMGELCSYLRADPDEVLAWHTWRANLGPEQPTLGLVWRGNPDHTDDATRSLPFPDALEAVRVARAAGWRVVVAQQPLTDEERAALTEAGAVLRAPAQEGDLAATAALFDALDLVVSVDSAPIHLAGALGRPAVLLQSPLPEWRWAYEGTTTRLYPTVTILRARYASEWGDVLEPLSRSLVETSVMLAAGKLRGRGE